MDDLRHAVRTLRKQPGFVAVAIVTLAFGIGVNITLFSMVSAFFLQPLPVRDAHQLVVIMQRGQALNIPHGHSYPDYRDYRETTAAFTDLAAYLPTPVHMAAPGGTPERTWIEVVSPNYFALAGVSPLLGQFPPTADDRQVGPPTVVLSHRYWQRRFGADTSLVGRPIILNGKAFTVIAIVPESFTGLSWAMAVSAFVPSTAVGALMEDGANLLENRGAHAWRLMGRLAPGRTIADARAEMEVAAARLKSAYPAEHSGSRILLMPENRSRPDPAIAGFLPIVAIVFLAMAGFVLLIACANVANLMLARAVDRQRDLVIRSALGASRWRIVRQLVVESLVLAAMAGVVGVLLAAWAGDAVASLTPTGDVPINDRHAVDWRAYGFTFVVSAAAGVITGLWPALKATRFSLVESLKHGSGIATGSGHRLRNVLVVGQVMLSLVVLASGGLFAQSLRQLKTLDIGFNPDGIFITSIDLGLQQYSDSRGRRFVEDLLERADALPGVVSATVTSHVPFEHAAHFVEVITGNEIAGSSDDRFSTAYSVVGPRFFETFQTPIVRGRPLRAQDSERSAPVAVVNETMARRLWPGREAVGQRLRLDRNETWIEVVGVARDGRYVALAEQPRPYLYLPFVQHYRSPITLVVRSASEPAMLAAPVHEVLKALDQTLPTFNARTMNDLMRDSVFALMPLRAGAAMASVLAALVVFLVVMGLYAVVSHASKRRVREIGVRMALGADAFDVMRLVVKDGMRLCLIGASLGLLIAAAIGFVLSHVLHGLPRIDLPVLAASTALLVVISAAACYAPARRATRIDPLTALRTE